MDHRRVKYKVKHATARQRKAAENMSAGMTIKAAMLDAGYSESMAIGGLKTVPRVVLALMGRDCNLVALGRSLDPEIQEHLVRGRLAYNVIKGQDKGVNSAFRLGSDKKVSMFQSENQAGAIVVNLQVNNGTEVPAEQDPQEKK